MVATEDATVGREGAESTREAKADSGTTSSVLEDVLTEVAITEDALGDVLVHDIHVSSVEAMLYKWDKWNK